jgi:universal stress protein E
VGDINAATGPRNMDADHERLARPRALLRHVDDDRTANDIVVVPLQAFDLLRDQRSERRRFVQVPEFDFQGNPHGQSPMPLAARGRVAIRVGPTLWPRGCSVPIRAALMRIKARSRVPLMRIKARARNVPEAGNTCPLPLESAMKPYERILLVARPDMQRSPAFREAALLARETGAALHVVIFDHSATLDIVARLRTEDVRGLRETFLRQRRDWLEAQAQDLRQSGITVTSEAVWCRHSFEEILAHAVEFQADLVVKDVDMHRGMQRVLMTSLDWQLLRECPAPLLLVHREQLTPRRIVVAADVINGPTDELNRKIVRHAAGLAYATNAKLHLAYAFQAFSTAEAAAPMAAPALTGDLYEALYQIYRQAFNEMADANSVPQDARHFLIGPAAPALTNFARESDADVIVMGTTYHDALDRLLIGSTASAMLDDLPCSVLVVKPDALAATLAQRVRERIAISARQAA